MSSDSGPLSPRNVTPCVPVLIEKSGHLQFKQGKAHFFPLILISGSALSPLACQVVVSLMVSSVMGFWLRNPGCSQTSCSDPIQGSPFLWCQVDLGEEQVELDLFLSDPLCVTTHWLVSLRNQEFKALVSTHLSRWGKGTASFSKLYSQEAPSEPVFKIKS